MTLSCIVLVIPAAFHSSQARFAPHDNATNGASLFATVIDETSKPGSGLLLLSRCAIA